MTDTTPTTRTQIFPEFMRIPLNGRLVTLRHRPDLAIRIVDIPDMAGAKDVHVWEGHGFVVISSLDTTHHGRLRHVSISRADRDPVWSEIRAIREAIYSPSTDVMMVLPQEADYVNIHEHCFHLWQCPQEWGIQ